MTRLFLLLLALVLVRHTEAQAHALQPGYLELTVAGEDTWQVLWKVPSVGGAPMPIEVVLPETCGARRPPALRFDGTGFVASWQTRCPAGLGGGTISIEGLEVTATDVLARAELEHGQTSTARLTPSEPEIALPEDLSKTAVLLAYLRVGVEHILEGFDHLLFVFALLLLIPDRTRLLGAVTAFTVAHSLSLAAATLGWLVVPAPPVEAVIALSIMFLAAELVRPADQGLRLSQRHPWAVAFAFGLLHGLGFARALLDIGLPQSDVPLALLAFNLGVEAGQILFMTVVLVAGFSLRLLHLAVTGRHGALGGLIRPSAGYALGGMAAIWFVERVTVFGTELQLPWIGGV